MLLSLLACADPPVGTIRVGDGDVAAAQEEWIAAHPGVPVLHRFHRLPFLTVGPPEPELVQPAVRGDVLVIDQAFDPAALVGGACFATDCGEGGLPATAGPGAHGVHVVAVMHDHAPALRVVGVRVFDAGGTMRLVDLLRALEWAAEAPPPVLNLSLGLVDAGGAARLWPDPDACAAANPALAWIIADLQQKGTVVVAASGDEGAADRIAVPACLPGVVAVAAASGDTIASFANRSPSVSRLAPGVDVPVNGTTASGSSLAAARVSAELAWAARSLEQGR